MRSPECPRCGYDLSGKLEGYRESCPLEDVCSECGCAIRWSRATGDLPPPWWYVEQERYGLWRTVFPTLVMLIAPLRMWRRVSMEHELRWRRAMMVPIGSYLLCGLLMSGALGAEAYRALQSPPRWYLNAWPSGTGTAAATRIVGGLVNPLAAREFSVNQYSAALFNIWFQGATRNVQHKSLVELVHWPPSAIGIVPLATGLCTPVVFLLPASTRKRYRIRAWHIARIGIYGMAGAIVISFIGVVYDQWTMPPGWELGWRRSIDKWFACGPVVPIAIAGLWNTVLWWSATRRYLRIERAFSFAGPLVLAGLLAGFTITVVLLIILAEGDAAMSVIPGGRHLI